MPNYANSIFLAQELANNCASEILNSYANYENSRNNQKQEQIENDEYNQLVDSYNRLLEKAKEIASYHKEAQQQNAILQQNNDQVAQENLQLFGVCADKDSEIKNLKSLLQSKDVELNQVKSEVEKLRETVFTFTLVNTIMSTKVTALKNVLNNWNEINIYKKQGFINAIKEEVKKTDYAKNKIPTTNSVEATAYLESNNKPLFDKLKELSI